MNLGEDRISRETVGKEIGIPIRHLGEEIDKRSAQNESLRGPNQEIIGLQMIPLRQKPSARATKKLREHIEEQHLAKFSGWCMPSTAVG